MKPRNLALKALDRQDTSPGSAERFLERSFRERPALATRDRALTVHLVQGVLRWRLRIDWVIGRYARSSFEKIHPSVLSILRIALYQILFMDKIPDSAAVNEAVAQARGAGHGHAAGFVNALLRNVCRSRDRIELPGRGDDPIRYLSVRHSYPEWLVEQWVRELGEEPAERLMEACNLVPRLVVRVNTLRIDRGGLLARLEREGVRGSPTRYAPEGVVLEGVRGPVTGLASFGEGLFQVQGEAAQVSSHLLAPRPGETVLDVCAGLGGKSTHLAALMGGLGSVPAVDLSHERLRNMVDSARRLGVGCTRPLVADACGMLPFSAMRPVDGVLVDGPCSGLGTLSKHPDGKWARSRADVERLSRLQTRILDGAVPLVRPGGRLLYLTCTISRRENEDVAYGLCEAHRDMRLVNLKARGPAWASSLVDEHGFLKALPHVHGTEGFFGALFVKEEGAEAVKWEK